MPVILGNIIAILIVAAIVWLSIREIRKSHKSGGCSGSCATCGKGCSDDKAKTAVRK